RHRARVHGTSACDDPGVHLGAVVRYLPHREGVQTGRYSSWVARGTGWERSASVATRDSTRAANPSSRSSSYQPPTSCSDAGKPPGRRSGTATAGTPAKFSGTVRYVVGTASPMRGGSVSNVGKASTS